MRKSEGCEDDIYAFFVNEPNADSLFVKLVEEFERCILSYFGFHWGHAELMISQVPWKWVLFHIMYDLYYLLKVQPTKCSLIF